MHHDEYRRMFEAEDSYWWFVSRRRLARRLLEAGGAPEGPLLDLGCGTGAATAFFQQACPDREVLGADFSPEALKFASGRGLRRLVRADAEALPLGSRTLGAIVCLDLLEHVRDDRAAAGEAFRCLVPGGLLVANVPAHKWLWGPHDAALMHYRRYTRGEVSALLEGAGFQIETLSHSLFLLFPLVVAQRILAKIRLKVGGEEQVTMPQVPDRLNQFLIRLLELEATFVRLGALPWGSSLTVVARRPKG